MTSPDSRDAGGEWGTTDSLRREVEYWQERINALQEQRDVLRAALEAVRWGWSPAAQAIVCNSDYCYAIRGKYDGETRHGVRCALTNVYGWPNGFEPAEDSLPSHPQAEAAE